MVLGKEQPDSAPLALPCGGCLGCRTDKARQWALRCHLELQSHESAVFTTLTYADDQAPPTLAKSDLSGFLKRVRKALPGGVRFFASGEYGERTNRPHYHALLYGPSVADARRIEAAWGHGFTRTEAVTPARIAYVAGYCQKKIGYKLHARECVDPSTGEVFAWQPPFIQMSRRPGIGANAKRWPESWRLFGVHNGREMPVPRYLHEAWRNNATALETESLDYEKSQRRLQLGRDLSPARLAAAEEIAAARHSLRGARRSL
nr:MAG: replication initiator protein [Microvirus sp.]